MEPQQNCIFCQISQGKISAQKIFEDDDFIAVLDINPANPGHTIVMPKAHFQVMPQIPDDQAGKMMIVVKKVSQAMLRALKAQGTSIFIANGAVAGQRAPHFMLHIIPRVDGDGINLEIPKKAYSIAEMQDTRKKIYSRISQATGAPPVEEQIEKPRPHSPARVSEPKVEQKVDVIEATRFVTEHKELLAVLQVLLQGPADHEQLQQKIEFDINHLDLLAEMDFIKKSNDKYEITPRGKKFIEGISKPLPPPVPPTPAPKKEIHPPPAVPPLRARKGEDFDLDKLTELLGK